jgi:hypothetical protein
MLQVIALTMPADDLYGGGAAGGGEEGEAAAEGGAGAAAGGAGSSGGGPVFYKVVSMLPSAVFQALISEPMKAPKQGYLMTVLGLLQLNSGAMEEGEEAVSRIGRVEVHGQLGRDERVCEEWGQGPLREVGGVHMC